MFQESAQTYFVHLSIYIYLYRDSKEEVGTQFNHLRVLLLTRKYKKKNKVSNKKEHTKIWVVATFVKIYQIYPLNIHIGTARSIVFHIEGTFTHNIPQSMMKLESNIQDNICYNSALRFHRQGSFNKTARFFFHHLGYC